jgi:ketosteroid isomerase-like protein
VSTHQLVERFLSTLEARDWDGWTATMHEDVVYELPQSRERISGRDRYLQFNQEYPGDWHLRPKVVIADHDHGVGWFGWTVGASAEEDAMAFFGFRDELIAIVTDFWPEAYDAPAGREHLTERW